MTVVWCLGEAKMNVTFFIRPVGYVRVNEHMGFSRGGRPMPRAGVLSGLGRAAPYMEPQRLVGIYVITVSGPSASVGTSKLSKYCSASCAESWKSSVFWLPRSRTRLRATSLGVSR